MQNRDVIYREIEETMGITSIHKMLHEHLSVEHISTQRIPNNLTITKKKRLC